MQVIKTEWRSLLTLDVGCSNGAMPYISRKEYGLQSFGFEINDEYPNWDKLEEEGIAILGLEKDDRWFDGSLFNYDVITFYDVFEHMSDPFLHMEMIAEKLKFGGIVVFEQPNPASDTCYEQGIAWKHFRPFQHFYLFSKENFEEMFEMFGLKMVFYAEHLPGRLCVIGKKV
jgi:cyclopropane fatty-acyl-phospholipid synthase-like methyltransferase